MTTILLDNKGTLDKYIGDAIVAFFGAPMPVKNHEYCACKTALDMQAQLKVLREQWISEGDRWTQKVHKMQNRIGIHTGLMVTGNMGSEQRMNYTMMGDTVNLAARLESSCKQYGIYTQISEDTYKAIKDDILCREVDRMVVMGRKEPITTYEKISSATATEIFGKDNMEQNKVFANDFTSLLLTNNNGIFRATPLPRIAQLGPVFGIDSVELTTWWFAI